MSFFFQFSLPGSKETSIDTDSVMYLQKEDEADPLVDLMGDDLGRLTDEIKPGFKCLQFVSQAPKVKKTYLSL